MKTKKNLQSSESRMSNGIHKYGLATSDDVARGLPSRQMTDDTRPDWGSMPPGVAEPHHRRRAVRSGRKKAPTVAGAQV
jgi:hypothetical protein